MSNTWKHATDCFAQEDITALVKLILSKKTTTFLDWFTYSDNTIDGKSKKKAYTFLESNLVADEDVGTVKSLQQMERNMPQIALHKRILQLSSN